jgi:hypothetical protein
MSDTAKGPKPTDAQLREEYSHLSSKRVRMEAGLKEIEERLEVLRKQLNIKE